jgi:predicted nucleotidyltransferase
MTFKTKVNSITVTPHIDKMVSFLFSRLEKATHLYLLGSRARGDWTPKSDWDFAIDAGKPLSWDFFAVLRQEAADIAFPEKIDLIDLNRAPAWFREKTDNDLLEILR